MMTQARVVELQKKIVYYIKYKIPFLIRVKNVVLKFFSKNFEKYKTQNF